MLYSDIRSFGVIYTSKQCLLCLNDVGNIFEIELSAGV